MHIEIQVEEPSAEAALKHLVPTIVGDRATSRIINYGSKSQLLKRLPDRLKAYGARIRGGEDLKLLVLVDRDADDCSTLKDRLERMAADAGLKTRSAPDHDGTFAVVNRLAIEELEAWFIGDGDAVRAAFPGVRPFEARAPFRDPDQVRGGTWEALHRLLKGYGHYRSDYPKIEAARRIAPHMSVTGNRSASFRAFRSGFEALLGQPAG